MNDPKSLLFKTFAYWMPTGIIYGFDAVATLEEHAKRFPAEKALIITDEGIVKAGVADKVKGYLEAAQIEVSTYDEVVTNPTVESIEDALHVFRNEKPEILVGLGGGSSIDTAKLVGARVTNPDISIVNLEGFGKINNPRNVPLIAIETAAGTGSEVTPWAVTTDTKRKRKFHIGDVKLTPDLAFLDPLLTVSLPPQVTAESGMDALSHAIECYVTKEAWSLTDALAIAAIELISNNIRLAVINGENLAARDNMLMGSLLAGIAFPNAGVGMVHGMGYPLSGFYNIGHGATMGMLLPYVEEFNLPTNYKKFAKIASIMGEEISDLPMHEAAQKAVVALKKLNADISIPTLKEVGIKREDIPVLAESATSDEINMRTNPRPMNLEDIRGIYERALDQE